MWALKASWQMQPQFPDLLPWCGLIAPGIVLNKDGALMRTLAFRGPDLDAVTDSTLRAMAARCNNLLKRFGGGWALYIEAQRRESIGYPLPTPWAHPVAAAVDAERRAAFTSQGTHYESFYTLTACWLPPLDTQQRVTQYLFEHVPQSGLDGAQGALTFFVEQTKRFLALLQDTMAWAAFLDDDATLTYLHSTVSTQGHPVVTPDMPYALDWLLATEDLTGGIYPKLGDAYLRTCTLRSFPGQTFPGILDRLNHLGLCYRWVTRYLPLEKGEAMALLKSHASKWGNQRKGMIQRLFERYGVMTEKDDEDMEAQVNQQDVRDAMEDLVADVVSYGYFTATVTVWDTDPGRAEDKLQLVERTLHSEGLTTHAETLNALEAWLGSLPGHCYANVRRPVLHSINLAHLMPMSAAWAGPEGDAHLQAPPLLVAESHGQTPFRVVLHDGDVGHTLVLGPTGSGKTFLLGLLALQWQARYPGAQVFAFDKKRGLEPVTRAVGGLHYTLGGEATTLAFQPLQHIDQERERRWAASWIEGILVEQSLALTPALRSEVWRALSSLATAPPAQRTLTGLGHLLQFQELRQALEPVTLSGAYGQYLDAAEDTLHLSPWCCFELDELFQLPGMVAAVLAYIFHRLAQRFTGAPTLLLLDEAWRYLAHPLFLDKIGEWLRELRKLNVGVIFSTQSVADAVESPLAAILLESCPLRLFLPNPQAAETGSAALYGQLGLNERQRELIATATPKRDYLYVSPAGCRLVDLAVGDYTKRVLTGGASL